MLKELLIAIQAYYRAHKFVFANRKYKMLIGFGVFYALAFGFCLYLYFVTSVNLTSTLLQKTNIKTWLQSSNAVLTFFFALSIIMLHWIILLYYFSLVKYVLFIIGSPLFAYISKKIIKEQTPIKTSVTIKRSIIIALQNLLWQTLYFILFFIICLIPVIGWIVPLIAIFAEAYFYGHCAMDYALAEKGLSRKNANKFIEQYKGFAIGNGLLFYALHLIPVIGWVFAPIYSIIAANISIENIKINEEV